MYGKDYGYAESRLCGSILRTLGGKCIIVHNVDGDCVEAEHIISGEQLNITLEDINYKPLPLGFVNHGVNTSYLSRKPKRDDWKQGMRRSNTAVTFSLDNTSDVSYKDVCRSVENGFPSFSECLSLLSGDTNSVSWHRHWAIDSSFNIYYKSLGVVGKYYSGELTLSHKYDYLNTYLQRSL